MRRQIACAAAIGIAGAVLAATVTVNPPAGTETNVWAFASGEDVLAVNTGATGGTVRLNPNNAHTGGTTLNSGTLVVTHPARAGEPHELGAGPFTQTGGTLRYAGPAGGTWTGAVTNNSVGTASVVWQIDSDLTMSGAVGQPDGAFIKTGKGTLTFTEPFVLGGGTTSTSSNRKKLMDLSPDRAPTQGYGPVTITDGAIVIDVASTNENWLGGNSDIVTVGAWTTSEAGKETAGVLIQSNGVTRTFGSLTIGNLNGNTVTAPEPLTSAVLVRGGTFYVGNKGVSALYLGGGSGISGTYRSAPLLEVAGAGTRVNCGALYIGYTKGGSSTVRVRDGGYLYLEDYNSVSGSNSGSAATTNLVEITGAGSQIIFRNFTNQNSEETTFRIADGGALYMRNFVNSKGKLHLIVDGGTWKHRNHDSDTPQFPSTMTSIKIGPGGMTTYSNGGDEEKPIVWEKGIEPLDDSGTDGGLHITTGKALPPMRLNAANTYCGPTEISVTRVYLGKSGRLPAGTDLSIYTSNGGLIITNGITQTVGAFSFGRNTATESPYLGFSAGSGLSVTGEMSVGNRTTTRFHLFETQGKTNALATAGTYTFVTAREEDFAAIAQLAGSATFPLKPDDVTYTAMADVADGRARLRVVVSADGSAPAASGDPLLLNNPVLNTTLTATAEQLAAARTIHTNPGYSSSKHGSVELGALSGFAAGGTLSVGMGTTYASDLSFATSVSNIVLHSGTLAYTGGDATIPGLAIAAANIRSSVLNVTNENTTLTIEGLAVASGGLTKNGLGTLKLKPPAGTTMTLPYDHADNGDNNGVSAYGDGPASGTRAFNIVDGWVEIGTAGDPSDAPDIYGPFDFSVGSQARRNGTAEQTAGNLRMNNGSLYVTECLYIGYYCGNYASNPDLNLTPTIEQNGGLINCAKMQIGQSAGAATGNRQTDSPHYFLHGGTNIVRGNIYAAYTAVSKADTWRTAISVDGGRLCVSNDFFCGHKEESMATDVAITGGRVEVGGTFYPAYNVVRETNTFLLAGSGVLRAGTITGNGLDKGLVAIFDGGTVETLVGATANSDFRYMQRAYVGAGGLNFDLSHQTELEGPTTYWYSIQQPLEPAPGLGDTPDGGVTLRGAGTAAFSTSFENGTFTGPIRVKDGARAVLLAGHVAPFAVEVTDGGRLSDYDGAGAVLKDLALGTAGATESVSLELRRDVPTQGFVVTNSLSVLSPVAITTHGGTHDLAPMVAAGTYTALVYSASNADVDLSLFTLAAADAASATISAQQVTVADGGAYDGMKAVVVTIAARNGQNIANGNVWTKTSGAGNWSDTANWENALVVPNGAGQTAYFNPATAAGVGVTLDSAVTLGTLTFNASAARNGYALSGSPLTLDNGARVAAVANASGTNTIACAVALASDAELQTTAGNELRVTGGVSGDKDLDVNTHVETGAGQVNLHVSPDYAGRVTTGSGRVVMDDLSFIQSPDQLTLGLGTLLYTGPDVGLPGLRLSAITNRPAVLESDADVTLDALTVSGTAAFLKRGTGTLRLHGTGTFAPNTHWNYASTSKVAANGDGPAGTSRGLTVATGTFIQGEVDDPDHAPTVSVASHEIAVGTMTTQGDATYVLNNGTFTDTASFYVGYYSPKAALSPRATLSFIQNGGTLKVTSNLILGYTNTKWNEQCNTYAEFNGGSSWFGAQLYMGRDAVASKTAQTSHFVQNGGTVAFAGNVHLAYKANTAKGYMDLNGGELTCSNTFYAAYATGNDSTLRLNASATLRCNAFAATADDSTTRLYANGGTFRPLCRTAAAQTMPANAFTYLYSSTNGLVVDTAEALDGAAFTMEQAILHDPALDAAADGGLVKRGAGLLTLAGVNTYTGGTAVEGGVLALSGAGTLGTGASLAVADGAACDLGGTSQSVGTVTASGLVRNGALTVTDALLVGESVLSVDGELALERTATVDFAGRAGLDLDAGEPVAVVSGAATLPASMKTANAGDTSWIKFVRDGTVVYALKAPGGTVFVIR